MTIKGFRREVASSIRVFVEKYGLNFNIKENDEAENILNNLFKEFYVQRNQAKIYVIIDEYDHFANELLEFNIEKFTTLVSKNKKVRKWYEILKEGTESVVNRIFITGVVPITLDSLTSGFNISFDITRDPRFNEMMGFSKQELQELMCKQEIAEKEQEIMLPIMKEYYDGYKFSVEGKEKMYNPNMCLYFLNNYMRLKDMPENMIDMNIASDYSKLGKMLKLYKGGNRQEIIKKTIMGEGITSDITGKFNPEVEFSDKELVSMLYYLGYLTIEKEEFGWLELVVPNKVMRELYVEYLYSK